MPNIDFKRQQKQYYQPKTAPEIIAIPQMQFVAVKGSGDPNETNGDYAAALSILYSISYTIKMSERNGVHINGFYSYVVPPLEGLWWMNDGSVGYYKENKAGFSWVSMIRLPDFVTPDVFAWAKDEAAEKKKIETARAFLYSFEEGLCVQCMHLGSYDLESQTVERMDNFAINNGYQLDFSDIRRHHELYLNDPRKTAPERLKTVIRHPIAPAN